MRQGIRRVVVGVSGGVDSAVSTLLLKRKGFDVVGVFMQNWDANEETGGECTIERDFEDAERVCKRLGVPLTRVNFVKEYWNDVFSDLLENYETGFTPNPDIRCNELIKFRTFYDHARETLAADAVATGHYADTNFGPYLEDFAPDKSKENRVGVPLKTHEIPFVAYYWDSLRRTMFPVGRYLKKDVIKIAIENGLGDIARKKESMGICFIGNRRFREFISEYMENRPGNFVDLETGQIVGKHDGIHQWTLGQRCNIGGAPKPYFIYRKDVHSNDIHVVQGTNHPALYSELVLTDKMHWINQDWDEKTNIRRFFDCDFRFKHTKELEPSTVFKTFENRLIIRLKNPLRSLTPGQFAVLYHDNECLGSAKILNSGPSLYSLNQNYFPKNKSVSLEDDCPEDEKNGDCLLQMQRQT